MNARIPLEMAVTQWQPVCRLDELPVLGARRWLGWLASRQAGQSVR